MEKYNLTISDRALLVLSMYSRQIDHYCETYPVELTQAGVAQCIGRTRAHIAQVFKDLQSQGLIDVRSERVAKARARMKVGVLTPSGEEMATRLRSIVKANGLSVDDAMQAPRKRETDVAAIMERIKCIEGQLENLKAIVSPLLKEDDQQMIIGAISREVKA